MTARPKRHDLFDDSSDKVLVQERARKKRDRHEFRRAEPTTSALVPLSGNEEPLAIEAEAHLSSSKPERSPAFVDKSNVARRSQAKPSTREIFEDSGRCWDKRGPFAPSPQEMFVPGYARNELKKRSAPAAAKGVSKFGTQTGEDAAAELEALLKRRSPQRECSRSPPLKRRRGLFGAASGDIEGEENFFCRHPAGQARRGHDFRSIGSNFDHRDDDLDLALVGVGADFGTASPPASALAVDVAAGAEELLALEDEPACTSVFQNLSGDVAQKRQAWDFTSDLAFLGACA
eukprot:TRINITY_DN12247_c0_g1_i2.p2 TRINITY_DN12247_c0_g1~~TRINITY_DN12247_c0_g1_i2.p2  ORF type:complete len:290 (+),score=58.29 TRINITY_DN12247_c0_g1_i2:922-1791(+)